MDSFIHSVTLKRGRLQRWGHVLWARISKKLSLNWKDVVLKGGLYTEFSFQSSEEMGHGVLQDSSLFLRTAKAELLVGEGMPDCCEIPLIAKTSQRTTGSMFYMSSQTGGTHSRSAGVIVGRSLMTEYMQLPVLVQLLEISQGLKPDSRKFSLYLGMRHLNVLREANVFPNLESQSFWQTQLFLNAKYMFFYCCDDEVTWGLAILPISRGKFMEEAILSAIIVRKLINLSQS